MKIVNIVLASLQLNERLDLKAVEKPVSGCSIYADVFPRERQYLKLDTGGIWSNPNWSELKHDEYRVTARLSIHEQPDDQEHQDSLMIFDQGSDANIIFIVRVDKPAMDDLIENIRAGLIPSNLSLMLAHDIFSKNQPFDGDTFNGDKWIVSKKENQKIKIEHVSFFYELLKPQKNESTGELIEPESGSLLEYARTEVGVLKNTLGRMGQEIKNARNLAYVLLGIYIVVQVGRWSLG